MLFNKGKSSKQKKAVNVLSLQCITNALPYNIHLALYSSSIIPVPHLHRGRHQQQHDYWATVIVSTVLRTSPIYFAQTRTDVLSEPSATILREQLVYEDTIFNQPQTTFLVPLHYLIIIMHANVMPSFHSLYS